MIEHINTIRQALITARFEAEHAMMYDESTDRSWMGDADMVARIDAALAALDDLQPGEWQPVSVGAYGRVIVDSGGSDMGIVYDTYEDTDTAYVQLPPDLRLCRLVSQPAPVPATVPPPAVLDAMGRCLEDLLLWHDGDASNMSDQLFEDYVDVRAWLNEQPVGFLNQQEKS